MARITLADWTCSLNGCLDPLSPTGLADTSSLSRSRKLPIAYLTARHGMASFPSPLQLRLTDQSHISLGNVSIEHVSRRLLRIASVAASCPSDSTLMPRQHYPSSYTPLSAYSINALHHAGLNRMSELGRWSSPHDFELTNRIPTPGRAFHRHWELVRVWAASLSFGMLVDGEVELSMSRPTRQSRAESLITFTHTTSKMPGLGDDLIVASDGAMMPASALPHQQRIVTTSVVNRNATVFLLSGRSKNVLHAEAFGLVAAKIFASNGTRLISDHRNSVNILNDPSPAYTNKRLRHGAGRSYYRWFLSCREGLRISIEHVKAHTGDPSIESRSNACADHYASTGLRHYPSLPVAPEPTFCMDDYTFFTELDGYIESNIVDYVKFFCAASRRDGLARLASDRRMYYRLYDQRPPPRYPYLLAPSAYSAVTQLYARSGQLDTPLTMCDRKLAISDTCEFGCPHLGTPHHYFVQCGKFDKWRMEYSVRVERALETRLQAIPTEDGHDMRSPLWDIGRNLFRDHDTWPLGYSVYYLGWIPDLERSLDDVQDNHASLRAVSHLLVSDWHYTSISLAGRIWGAVVRERTRRWRMRDL